MSNIAFLKAKERVFFLKKEIDMISTALPT